MAKVSRDEGFAWSVAVKDVFIWAYERSAERYAAVRQSWAILSDSATGRRCVSCHSTSRCFLELPRRRPAPQ
jgi:hypothetical protein